MSLRALSEAIILQQLEDLYDERHTAESLEFFSSEGFSQTAALLGLDARERMRIMALATRISRHAQKQHKRRPRYAGRAFTSPHALPASPSRT
ncbi:MAG: hypothetical protein P8Y66_00265 [Nitrospirota bacterium]|jgi:hypothetical protein